MMVKNLLIRLIRLLKRSHIKRYQRSVSLGDILTQRWQNADDYGFGEGTSCYDNVLIINDVTIGKNTWIGPNVVLDGSGKLTIGNNVTISAGVQIYTHNSLYATGPLDDRNIPRKSTIIGDNVYIGPNSIITMGVVIGDNAIIGALSYVDKSLPEKSRFYGSDKSSKNEVS